MFNSSTNIVGVIIITITNSISYNTIDISINMDNTIVISDSNPFGVSIITSDRVYGFGVRVKCLLNLAMKKKADGAFDSRRIAPKTAGATDSRRVCTHNSDIIVG